MLENKRPVFALVPARGGSKGISKKNLALLNARPLVWYALHAAQSSPVVDAVWLSSDDEEILQVGRDAGVNLIRRPDELASDHASAIGVVEHFLCTLPAHLMSQDPVVLYLQPTSPLRTARHIGEALDIMQRKAVASVVSVVEQRHSPFKCFKLDDQGRLQSLFDETLSNLRRQDLPATYLPNGAIYAFLASEFKARGGFPSNGSAPYIMSERDSVDVDTPDDLKQVNDLMGATHA
jgi:CMP-N,N'-diacetyllegionaminic acid synthase